MTSDPVHDTPLGQRGTPGGDTRQRLIAAAREIICEAGLKQARMEDIATRAGVSRAAAYYHFNTKADLVGAIIDDLCSGLTDIVRATLADGPLDGVIAATVRFFSDHVAVTRLLLTEITLDPMELVIRHRDALLSVLRRRVSADIAAGRMRPMDPDVAAQAIVGLIRVAPVEMICDESTDLEHLTAELTDFLHHALALTGRRP
jgi:TetR/AcrR family transcriptional regulator